MAAVHQRQSSLPRISGYSDPSFSRIADLAHVLAGLVFPANRQPSAEAGMRRAMSALHVSSPGELLRRFESPGPARDVVLAELTVGESYFFRDSAQLDLLVTDILPSRRASDGVMPMRVWSAGCASGEEPYTIAIMLREQGWANPTRILATDIARPRLAAAQRGRYTRWALRGVSEERVARWFTRNGSYFDLAPAAREMVEFRALNLVVDDYATSNGDEQFDLILCRNVMIYFDLATVAHIATGLLASLAPDGWLLLGASDPPLAQLVPCESIMTPAGVAYRKPGTVSDPRHTPWGSMPATAAAPRSRATDPWMPEWNALAPTVPDLPRALPASAAAPQEPHAPASARGPSVGSVTSLPADPPTAAGPSIDALTAAYRSADYAGAESIAVTLLAEGPAAAPATWITYIRAVANQGRLNEAGELNARALELHPLDAELHYLHATLLMEGGWFPDAAAAVRRAIYLDRELAVGHLLLGEALSRSGDSRGARNAFANAAELLERVEATAAVRAADGVTASRLRQIATMRLRSVEAAIQ